MFAVETIPAQYYEERSAAEAARRLAEQRKAAALEMEVKAPVASRQASPSSLQQAMYHPPPLSSPGASTVLGSIFQTFVKKSASSPALAATMTPSRAHTPMPTQEQHLRAEEAQLANRNRDTGICTVPAWY